MYLVDFIKNQSLTDCQMEQENHYIMNLMSLKRNNNLFKKYKIAIFVT